MLKKILLVDDDSGLLEMLTEAFVEAGFLVTTADNGMQALQQARNAPPDIILMDLLLPDLDGLSVCEILRKQPPTASIPIVILTAVAGQILRLAGFEAGATDYVTKPFCPRDVVKRMTLLLETGRPVWLPELAVVPA